ncbi:MAG: FkbM family methyltransferase [Lachnospiraceae bacterium]|jgi:FkbM family methyltransferase|nr:FkbM family methyltransferase [Lachnospiraceae bacterium]
MNEIERLQDVYNLLEDAESKDIYLNRLNFLITKDYRYIRHIIETHVPGLTTLNQSSILNLLSFLPKDKPILLYGAGEDAKANLHYFEKDARFSGFCDRDPQKQTEGVCGYPVRSPEELIAEDTDSSIVISTHRGLAEIRRFLQTNGVDEKRIHAMSSNMFCIEPGQYFNPDFMWFEEQEVFIDAGSKDLKTAKELSRYTEKLKKVYAFEPDPDNYKECLRNREWFGQSVVEVIPYGTWSEKKTLYFDATADGFSHVTGSGGLRIQVLPIDDAVRTEERVTFIKMDVEGSELESLKGARNMILRDRPKLAICMYHKAEDMINLPLYIKSLVPEYKLYVRHHSNGAGETVLYAMPEKR